MAHPPLRVGLIGAGANTRSRHIPGLLALPNGDLWIGFRGKGVSRLRSGRNTNYTKSDGLPSGFVSKLVQDRDGTIWAGTDGGPARFDHDQWQPVGTDWGYPGGKVTSLFVDRHGTLWIAGDGNAVLFLPRGSMKLQATGIEIGQTSQIVESPDDAEALAPGWRRDRVGIVALAVPSGLASAAEARALLRALRPSAVYALADASAKNDDLFELVDAMGGVDALWLEGLGSTITPADVLALGIPVARLDGEAATPERWALVVDEAVRRRGAPVAR